MPLPVRSRWLPMLVWLTACRGDEPSRSAVPVPVQPGPESASPPIRLWTFEGGPKGEGPCLWRFIDSTNPEAMRELGRFSVGCEDADVAWSGQQAITWLRSRNQDHLFTLALGATPSPLPAPPFGAVHAVGFDDVPLVVTTMTRSDKNNVTAWAWVDGAWKERESGSKRLRALAVWKSQRGQSARTRREVTGATPMDPAVVASFDTTRSEDRATADVVASVDQALKTGTAKPVEGGYLVPILPNETKWWELEAGGVRLAIRQREDRFVPELRRLANGRWEPVRGPMTSGDRTESYPAGVERQGHLVILSSDGRGPIVVDTKTGLTPWGMREFALALFAP